MIRAAPAGHRAAQHAAPRGPRRALPRAARHDPRRRRGVAARGRGPRRRGPTPRHDRARRDPGRRGRRPTRTFLADNLTADGYDVAARRDARATRCASLERPGSTSPWSTSGCPTARGWSCCARCARPAGRGRGSIRGSRCVVVSGRAGETDRVRSFERGADDFVAKPFAYGELRLRVAALLRRARERRADGRLRVGELALDPLAREVRRARARGSRCRRRSSRCCARSRASRRGCSRRPSCCATSGASARSARRARSTATRAGCARSSAAQGDRFVLNVWGVGYRLVDGAVGDDAAAATAAAALEEAP